MVSVLVLWWPLSGWEHGPAPFQLGIGLSDVLFNPKYAGHVCKISMAVDNLGNIVCICDLLPGTSADVMIWDQCGPSRTHGQFFNFEVGAHDGA